MLPHICLSPPSTTAFLRPHPTLLLLIVLHQPASAGFFEATTHSHKSLYLAHLGLYLAHLWHSLSPVGNWVLIVIISHSLCDKEISCGLQTVVRCSVVQQVHWRPSYPHHDMTCQHEYPCSSQTSACKCHSHRNFRHERKSDDSFFCNFKCS